MLIVFEGIDGSGKSTQAVLLAEKLRQNGFAVLLTSEPTDGPVGTKIKQLRTRLTPEEEMELFTEDRKSHVRDVIIPAIEEGKIVVCDRYFYSSAAYQGASGLDPHEIINANLDFAPRPDITFFLRVSTQRALERLLSTRGNSLSPYETRENLEKVAEVYAIIRDSSFVDVDAESDVSEVHCEVWRRVYGRLRCAAMSC
ncbi:MAG: dTMP kinase [Desulfomonilaceae bacterium]